MFKPKETVEAIKAAVAANNLVFIPSGGGAIAEVAPLYREGKLARIEIIVYNQDSTPTGRGDVGSLQ